MGKAVAWLWASLQRVAATGALCCTGSVAVAAPLSSDAIFPPWQQGRNNDSVARGLKFTVPQVDVLADFLGDLMAPKLVLFVGGNYFFAMAPLVEQSLVEHFEKENPQFRGRIFWETMPPGLLARQMKAGGTITVGNMTWTVKPDAYFAGLGKVRDLIADGTLTGPPVPYVTNQRTIMVQQGNPKDVQSLNDLAGPALRLAMPNPEFQGVARQIRASLVKAGGDALASAVYVDKVKAGTSALTQIHHRQTALYLMQDKADAGVVWKSEASFRSRLDTRSVMSTFRRRRIQLRSTRAHWCAAPRTLRPRGNGTHLSALPPRWTFLSGMVSGNTKRRPGADSLIDRHCAASDRETATGSASRSDRC